MILFHGSNIDIQKIDLSKCRPNKDFGQGFYLTTTREQAVRMAQRVSRMFGGNAVLNIYQFDDAILTKNDLNIRKFEKPTIEWAKFVITNRNASRLETPQEDNNIGNKFDIVIGPVADDDLALLFRQFSDKVISAEILVSEMKFKKLTNQYSFHTEKAIKLLKKKRHKMSKKELLAEYITGDLIAYIVEDEKITMLEAMQELYSSEVFAKINDFDTGLYLESSPYVYDLYKTEKENGKFIQVEI